jgi:HSP20 family protein
MDKKNEKELESTKGYYYDKPECDIYESENGYKIYFDIPGVEKDDINLKLEKNILTMTAECSKKPMTDNRLIREEIKFHGYKRAFNLSSSVDPEKINADYENGTLTITLSKKEDKKTKEIKINVA